MSTTPPARASVWAGFVALAIAMGIGRFAFTPILPLMQDDLGLALSQGGWLASANYLGYFAGAVSASFLRWNASTLLRVGLFVVALTTALMGWTHTWSAWIAWRSIAGMSSAWVLVATASLCLGRLNAIGRPDKAGWVFSGVGTGITVAGLVCLLAEMRGITSSQTWLMLGAVAGVAMIATMPLWKVSVTMPSHHEPQPRNHGSGYRRLIVCYGVFGFGYILPATFLPAQAKDLLDDNAVFGLAWPLFGLMAALSTVLCGVLLRRLSLRQLWLLSQLVMAVGVIMPVAAPGLASIIIAATCVGGTFMVITMLGMQQAQVSAGPRARTLMANMTAAFAAGQLAGPVVFSLLNEHLGGTLDSSLYLACGVLLLGCVLLVHPFPKYAAKPA